MDLSFSIFTTKVSIVQIVFSDLNQFAKRGVCCADIKNRLKKQVVFNEKMTPEFSLLTIIELKSPTPVLEKPSKITKVRSLSSPGLKTCIKNRAIV